MIWNRSSKFIYLQLPATLHPGVTVVVSPLLSLIQDQIVALTYRFAVPAAFLNSQQTSAQASAVIQELRYVMLSCVCSLCDQIKYWTFVIDIWHISTWSHCRCGKPAFKLLYVTPERIVTNYSFMETLRGLDQRVVVLKIQTHFLSLHKLFIPVWTYKLNFKLNL